MISLEHLTESYTIYGIVHSTLWVGHKIIKNTDNGKLLLDRCRDICQEELAKARSSVQV